MFEIILIIVVIFVLYKILTSYRLNTFDTVCAFTGGLGSGKSLLSVETSIKLLKRKRREVRRKNHFRKKGNKLPMPLLYSSIPVRISRKENAVILTDKHLTLQEKLVEGSVCFIDEIGSFCSQFDYKAKNADIFDEFVRFYRHYTKSGFLVCNDQCSENIVLQVRRRLNTVYNLMGFRKFLFIYWVKVRNISVSEEIKTIEEQDTEDNMTTLIGFLPFSRRYDTHCYSPRYDYVPEPLLISRHESLKKLDILRLPKHEQRTLDNRIAQAQHEEKQKNQTEIEKNAANLLTNQN